MRALLGETFRLFGTHLYLFTLISLTVWLPAHVLLKYVEFFDPDPTGPGRELPAALFIQLFFDSVVVAGTVAALARIKLSLPVSYGVALAEGLAAWPRLLLVRFVVHSAVALPALAALSLGRPTRGNLLAGALVLLLAVLVVIALLRVAVVDSVVVLEGRNVVTAWGRAMELTQGQRARIFLVAIVLFGVVVTLALGAGWMLREVPALNHFVVRVLVDSAIAVSQSLFTVAFFLFYWRARGETPVEPVPPAPPPAV